MIEKLEKAMEKDTCWEEAVELISSAIVEIEALRKQLAAHRWIPVGEGLPKEEEPKGRAKRLYFCMATYNIWSVGYDYEHHRWPKMPSNVTHYRYIDLPKGDEDGK